MKVLLMNRTREYKVKKTYGPLSEEQQSIVLGVLRIARSSAKHYRSKVDNHDDLYAYAYLYACEAVQRYDATKNAKMETWVYYHVNAKISAMIRDARKQADSRPAVHQLLSVAEPHYYDPVCE